MTNKKFDLKSGKMPQEFVVMNSQELLLIDGGSRKDPHQKGWYRKMAGFIVGSLISGPALGLAIAAS